MLNFEKVITLKEQYLYGSKRLGVRQPHVQLAAAPHGAGGYGTMPILDFEFVILNRRAFGSRLPGRTYVALTGAGYRFGFNGMQRDDEIKGPGNSLDFGARMYDSRLGRWMSVDPLAEKYPSLSPFNFALNSPLFYLDPNGRDGVAYLKELNGQKTLIISAKYYSELMLPTGTQEKVNCILNSYCGTVDFNGEKVQVQFSIHFEATPNYEIDRYGNASQQLGFTPPITNPDGLNPRGGVNLLKLGVERKGFSGEGDCNKIMADLQGFGGDIDGLSSALAHEIGHNIGFIHADGGIMNDQLKVNGQYIPNEMSQQGLQSFVNRIAEMTTSNSPNQYWNNQNIDMKTEGSPGITSLKPDKQ